MANPFVHVELQTRDLAVAKDFYTRLFGWQLQDMPMPGGEGTYTLIQVGEGTGGGMFAIRRSPPSGSPTSASRTSARAPPGRANWARRC